MMANFISAVLIKTVSLPCRLHIFRPRSGDFDQAPEAAEKSRVLRIQVEQHLVMWKFAGPVAQYDRCLAGQLVTDAAVWNEICRRESPQKIVELFDHRQVGCIDHYPETLAYRLGNEAAGDIQSIASAGVEVDLSHRIRVGIRFFWFSLPPARSEIGSTEAPAGR